MRLLWFVSTLVLLISCNDGATILYEHVLPPDGWSSSDIIDVKHAAVSSPVYLRVNHTAAYGYENLYVRITGDMGDHIISIPLMDDQGRWAGQQKGDSFITDYRINVLDKSASYQIEQYARTALLPGIVSIQVIAKAL